MNIIHNVNNLPRLASVALTRAIRTMPVVAVTGARQVGKSTLVRDLLSADDRLYLSLDDLDVLEQARAAPDDLLGRAGRLTLDEVQRAPDLLLAVKRDVDRRRRPGRFLLTGSANLLLLRQVADNLAGRAGYLGLWPMTRREQLGLGRAGLWSELLAARDAEWPAILKDQDVESEDWRALARRGGYPVPALEMPSQADRNVWLAGYAQTYLERDIQELASIGNVPDLRRLMRALCLRLGQMLNQSEIGRDLGLPQPTIHRWLNLFETSYQLVRLPAYSVNRTKRLMKSPKVYWADTGLALFLAGSDATGASLENIVLADLLAWRDARLERADVLYWRATTGEEVDFVIEAAGHLLPIEVKSSARARIQDGRHIQTFQREYGKASRAGLVLHTGNTVEWLAPGVLAAPWWRVL